MFISLLKRWHFLYFLISLAIALWCLSIGWGFTQALERSPILAQSQNLIRPGAEIGKDVYVSTCSGCHIAIPPEVLPTETWQQLLEKPNQHYGTSVPNLIRLSQLLIWDYLKTSSRPILIKDAPIPFYIEQSQYFKIIHPRVEFTEPITHKSCLICHPGVKQFDYRTLTPEWQDAP